MNFSNKLRKLPNWEPPHDWRKVTTIDAHTAGEPLRVIIDGFPELEGKTILGRRRNAKEKWDDLRTALMWEPRGHADMYGCLLLPPVSPEADFGVLFLHNEGYSTMCGHGIIAVTKVVLETGFIEKTEPETIVKIDTPAGLVTAHAEVVADGRVGSVRFQNVPSFVVALDEIVDVPGVGKIKYDLAFGGAFYAYVQAAEAGVQCVPEEVTNLIETGMAIKRAVMANRDIVHPFEPDLSFLYGTIFIAPPVGGAHSRNVCIFAEGEVDRSPTGTGVSGRLAIHHARGEVGLNQPIVIESILGTTFTGRVLDATSFGSYDAVIPEIEGNAFITGKHEFYFDPDDPLRNGFILR